MSIGLHFGRPFRRASEADRWPTAHHHNNKHTAMRTPSHTLLIALTAWAVATAWAQNNETINDNAKLQGEWTMVSGERDGLPFPDDLRKSFKRVAKGDEVTVTMGDQLSLKAKFTLDMSKKPKTIDYSVTGGPYAGNRQLGIYEMQGNTVKFCFSIPGKARPSDFSTKLRDGRTLTVWTQAKQ